MSKNPPKPEADNSHPPLSLSGDIVSVHVGDQSNPRPEGRDTAAVRGPLREGSGTVKHFLQFCVRICCLPLPDPMFIGISGKWAVPHIRHRRVAALHSSGPHRARSSRFFPESPLNLIPAACKSGIFRRLAPDSPKKRVVGVSTALRRRGYIPASRRPRPRYDRSGI